MDTRRHTLGSASPLRTLDQDAPSPCPAPGGLPSPRSVAIIFFSRVLAARWRASHLPMGLHGVSPRKDLSERARVHAGLRAGERASGLAAGYNAGQSAIRFSSHGDRARKPHSTARAQRERMCGAIPMQH